MVKLVGFVFVTVTLALSQGPGKHPAPAGEIKLWAGISVPHAVFEEAEAARIQVFFSVYNEGHSMANPNVEASHLIINGVDQLDWQVVIGSGMRNELFYALPPGETLNFTYQIGSKYFTAPGVYKVQWRSDNFESPELTFRVVPATH